MRVRHWRTDAQASTAASATSQTIFHQDGSLAAINRWTMGGVSGERYTYDPRANTVAISPFSGDELSFSVGGLHLFDEPSVAAFLSGGGHDKQAQVQPGQTLDGVNVTVVPWSADVQQKRPPLTAYFDSQSNLFRGLDLSLSTYSVQLRLRGYETMSADAVPPGAFQLNPPLAAQQVPHVDQPALAS